MFDSLSDRFEGIFKRLRGRGKLTERDIDDVAREIRLALLEADVNVRVVKSFIARIKERANGAEVARSLSPAQQVIKIVHEELVATLGGDAAKLKMNSRPPTVILLAGLQGSGKTTAAAKLARYLERDGKRPLLVGADLQRPAAVEQLRVLGERIGVPVYSEPTDAVSVARGAREEAARLGRDVIIVDTAGRLQIDAELMDELVQVRDIVQPNDTLLVVDAMTGQEAVNVATEFDHAVSITGVVITKIDGDARGGAALSVKEVVGKPILYAGTGEKLDEIEVFHPDRMASRILGLGDMLTLIEKAEESFDTAQKERAEEIMREGTFTLEDFLDQLAQVKKMGSLQNVIGMMPGMPKEVKDADIDDREIARVEAIIHSMTPAERRKPDLINGSRRTRIAKGSGTSTTEVNNLLKQFKQMQKMMQQMGPMGRMMTRKGKKKKGGRVTPAGTAAAERRRHGPRAGGRPVGGG